MSVIRKFNPSTGKWEVVAASSASSISVRSKQLLEPNEKESNVEKVLQRLKGDITTLKGNVSWLAAHGGGGGGGSTSGNSGGGSSSNDSIAINSQASNSQIILDDSLNIVIQSSDPSNNYQVTVNINNRNVFVFKGNDHVITKKMLADKGITSTFRLTVTAFNVKTLQSCYWNGNVIIPNISLVSPVSSYSYKFNNQDKDNIAISASVEILGYYTLKVIHRNVQNNIETTKDLRKLEFKDKNLKISISVTELKTLLGLGAGSTNLKFQLVSNENEQQKSNVVTTQLVLTADEPIISSTELSIDQNNPTIINIDLGNDIVVRTPFTAYYPEGYYKYLVSYEPTVSISDIQSQKDIIAFNALNARASIVLKDRVPDVSKTIYIHILANNQIYTQAFYIRTGNPAYELRPTASNQLFNFQSYSTQLNNDVAVQGDYTLTLHNRSALSGISTAPGSTRALRLQSYTYGTIRNSSKPYSALLNDFTLSISYRSDFHPDDARTLLLLGKLDNASSNLLQGIRLSTHELQINNSYLTLLDSELMTIHITYQAVPGTTSGRVFVYLNGVIEAAYDNVDINNLVPQNVNTIYLGAQPKSGQSQEMTNFSDLDLYRVSLYNKCLNPSEILNERLNDLAFTNLRNGSPNDEYIQQGLKRNFISKTREGENSLLWDSVSGSTFHNNKTDFLDCFNLTKLISPDGKGLISDINNYNLPIPILFIDVSNNGTWTWENFISPNPSMSEVTAVFSYADNRATNKLISGDVTVKLQGTSTLADIIKNLKITFADDILFTPKETWFPEQEYTLKADIVDSSHSLNASIGKFVNEKFGLSYDDKGNVTSTDSWYPFSKQVVDSYVAEKRNDTSVISKYFPKATLKHGIEGFPVFLLMRFRSPDNDSKIIVKSLGIYQFLLGRDSPRNFGYEIINNLETKTAESVEIVKNLQKNLNYPLYIKGVTISSKINQGYWIEATQNDPFPDNLHYSNIQSIDDKKLAGLFWQPLNEDTKDYYNTVLEIKYSNMGNDKVSSPSEFVPLKKFIDNVIKLPISTCLQGSTTGLAYKAFVGNYIKYKAEVNNNILSWIPYGNGNDIPHQYNTSHNNDDDLAQAVNELGLRSYSKYFVMAMFFGLIDNFAKNMPLKFIKNKTTSEWEVPLLGIYDMDTGLGGDNQGSLNVSTDVWLQRLANQDNNLREVDNAPGLIKSVTGQNNKLWYFDNHYIWQTGTSDYLVSSWNEFLLKLSGKTNGGVTLADLKNIVDDYYNNYFIPQTEGCGELLFNLTYFAKYINNYNGNTQLSKLHGRRQQQVYSWLNKRIIFLDSLFNAFETYGNLVPAHSPEKLSINSGSDNEFHLRTNYPVVSTVSHQDLTKGFYLLDNTQEHRVYWGSTSKTSTQVVHSISYPQALNILGNSKELSKINFQKTNNGKAVNLTKLDLSGCQQLASSEDIISAFKENNISELREIDLTNTKVEDVNKNFVLNLQGANKLNKLDLTNSAVTNITFPENPPQYRELIIKGSKLRTFVLSHQNLIDKLDLTGCTNLIELSLSNCTNIHTFSLDNLSNLVKLDINLSNLETLTIQNCPLNDSSHTPEIASDNLVNLTLSNIQASSIRINAHKLETLTIKYCSNLRSVILNGVALTTLDVINTPLSYIGDNYNPTLTTTLDLRAYQSLTKLGLKNTGIEYLQVYNNNVVQLISEFANPNLKRVYGKFLIECKNNVGIFQQCYKFRPYDSQTSQVDYDQVIPEGQSAFFYTDNGNATGLFSRTDSKLNDVYTAFKYGQKLRNVQEMFSYTALGITSERWLPRTLFSNCPNIQSVRGLFAKVQKGETFVSNYDNSDHYIILDSPERDEYGNVKENGQPGFFSNLTQLNDIVSILDDWYIICDRYLFRTLPNKQFTQLQSFAWITLYFVVDNVSEITSSEQCKQFYRTDPKSKLGNFTNFFKDIPNLKSIQFLGTTIFFNFDTTISLESSASTYYSCLSFAQSSGEIKINTLFNSTSQSHIVNIGDCFRQYSDTSNKATLELNNDFFKSLPGLRRWYCNSQMKGQKDSYQYSPFYGITKTFKVFPEAILDPIRQTIQDCDGLMAGISSTSVSTQTITLPGNIFKGCSSLRSVSGFFAGFPLKVNLKGFGFKDSPHLDDVSYLFAGLSKDIDMIPFGLLYHGSESVTKQKLGVTQDFSTDPTYANGQINGITPTVISTTIKVPSTQITNAMGLFQNNTIGSYNYDGSDVSNYYDYLNNLEYDPVTWYIYDGALQKNEAVNKEQYSLKWIFDGNSAIGSYTGTDVDDSFRGNRGDVINYTLESSIAADNHYLCPPDLLRYCSNDQNTNIKALFNGCGNQNIYNSALMWLTPNVANYGVHGRIPPHLLSPITSVYNISQMFRGCHLISAQQAKGSNVFYTIPRGFFDQSKVTDLTETFLGLCHVPGFDLSEISKLRGQLVLDKTFAFSVFNLESTPVSISGLFKNTNISSANGTFTQDGGYRPSNSHIIINQKLVVDNFKANAQLYNNGEPKLKNIYRGYVKDCITGADISNIQNGDNFKYYE